MPRFKKSKHGSNNHAWVDIGDDVIRQMITEIEPDVEAVLESIAGKVATAAHATDLFEDTVKPPKKPSLHLRNSILVRKSRFVRGGYIVKANVPHAHLVEYGHMMVTHDGFTIGHVAARPFLREARSSVRDQLGDIKLWKR